MEEISRKSAQDAQNLTKRRNISIVDPTKLIAPQRESTFGGIRRAKPIKQTPRFPLSKNQLDDLREAFDIFDSKSTGFITVNELRIAIRALGYEPMKAELDEMVSMVEDSKSGRIAFTDFAYLMNLRMAQNDKDDDITKAVSLINGGKRNGVITLKKLKQVAKELGEDINDEELQEMLDAADLDLNAYVDQQEFLAISKSLPNLKKH